jgi:hypothetical protein
MSVRRATIDDVELVAELGHKFIHAADMPPATIEECRTFCAHIIPQPMAGVFVSERGVIAGVAAPLYYKPSHLQVVELFWWAEDGKGQKLLDEFEEWGIAKIMAPEVTGGDVNMSTLEHFSHPGVEVLLKKRGYEGRDKTFRKVVK